MLDNILDYIKDIASQDKRADKMQMLSEMGPVGQRVLLYAYDPYRMFGVKEFDRSAEDITGPDFQPRHEDLFDLLDRLHSRELTGMKAQAAIMDHIMTKKVPSELLHRILNKDLRAGFTAETINKVFPKLIPQFKVALAHEYQGLSEGEAKMVSIKYDGLRCVALCDLNGDVQLKTRNGLPIERPEIVAAIQGWPWAKGKMLDGEILIKGEHFQDSSGAIRGKKGANATYYVFDWVPLEDFLERRSKMTQKDRYEEMYLASDFPQVPELHGVSHTMMFDDAQIDQAYRAVRDQDGEGLILKDPDAPYQFGRNKAWQKLKDVVSVDCEVIGLEKGKGKNSEVVGYLLVNFEGNTNRIGGGLSDEQRRSWIANPDLIVGKTVELLYHEKTPDGNMRHGRLHRVRYDK